MSEHKPKTKPQSEPKKFGWMAEFKDEHTMLAAARKVRDSGYTKTDAFTPFPVHGIDEALGIRPTILPWIVLCAGFTGLVTALTMEIWMNAIDYPYIISGKPYMSIPAFIPVAFELTILFSAFTTFLGMIALNQLPKFSNPVFSNPKFDRATNDRFFLYIDSSDKYYNSQAVQELLKTTSAESVEEVVEDTTPDTMPRMIWMTMLVLITASLSPLMVIFIMRNGTSENPRFHVFFDMDFQPKKKPQQTTTLFADGRIMRPQVAGTLARGQLVEQDSFFLGYDPTQVVVVDRLGTTLVSAQDPQQEPAGTEPSGTEPSNSEPADPEASKHENDSSPAKAEEPSAESATETSQGGSEEAGDDVAQEVPANAQTEAAESAPMDASDSQEEAASDAGSGDENGSEDGANAAADPVQNLPFVTTFPIEASAANMALGKQKFETYCAACHGLAGDGNGLVAKRADELAQGYWLTPTSLHDPRVREMPVGQIFYTITNGKGKMAGYAPSITPKERWTIAMYVEALQQSRNASLDDLSDEEQARLEDVQLKK